MEQYPSMLFKNEFYENDGGEDEVKGGFIKKALRLSVRQTFQTCATTLPQYGNGARLSVLFSLIWIPQSCG